MEKDKSGVILLILGMLLGLLIVFGMVSISNYSNRHDQNEENSEIAIDGNENDFDENIEEDVDGEEESTKPELDRVTAEKLYNIAFSESVWVAIDFREAKDGKNYVFDEVSAEQIALFIAVNMDYNKIEKVNICGTPYEEDLINKGVISRRNEGMLDCSVGGIKYEDLMKASKSLFGKEYDLKTSVDNFDSGYYYYSEGDFGMFLIAGAIAWDPVMTDYYILDNYAYIVINERASGNVYSAKYEIVGENYYIRSITKG